MLIDNLLLNPGPNIYYDSQFRIVLEDHMTYLRNLNTTRRIEIDIQNAYKYEGDLFGLLFTLNINPHLHFIVMRLNNMRSPTEYTNEIRSLLIPDETQISRIISAYKTKNKT